jgi:hypothetical protein
MQPNTNLSYLMHNFFSGKNFPNMFCQLTTFSIYFPTKKIALWTKIRPTWSPCQLVENSSQLWWLFQDEEHSNKTVDTGIVAG